MKQYLIAGVVSALAIILIGWGVSYLQRPKTEIIEVPQDKGVAYYIFSDSDNGTTTPVAIGGVVVVQLKDEVGSDKVSIIDDAQHSVTPKLDSYNGFSLISFNVPTTTTVTLSITRNAPAQDFTMIFKPFTQ